MFWKMRNAANRLIYKYFYAKYVNVPDSCRIVTFTFDDFPDSALFNGGKLLEKYGFRGTFYLAPELCEKTTEVGRIVSSADVNKCIEAGHEIGHHTFSHLDCSAAEKKEIIADIEKANVELGDIKAENFSYPFGRNNIKARKVLSSYFKSCRGIHGGINRGKVDVLNLKSNAVYLGNNNADSLVQKINDIKDNGGWLIFYTHDVTRQPGPYGCTKEMLENLIKAATESGLKIATVEEALAKFL
ncbi:MAG TPA: hypothetical protein ENJ08_19895 [Gammaproteobacteria bacterium]|nr:hypothetical protein [Gammaproteobacteria bacterium]